MNKKQSAEEIVREHEEAVATGRITTSGHDNYGYPLAMPTKTPAEGYGKTIGGLLSELDSNTDRRRETEEWAATQEFNATLSDTQQMQSNVLFTQELKRKRALKEIVDERLEGGGLMEVIDNLDHVLEGFGREIIRIACDKSLTVRKRLQLIVKIDNTFASRTDGEMAKFLGVSRGAVWKERQKLGW